jgi:hypothetical protein
MLIDILKDKRFDTMFSFLMGIFVILLIRPICKGDNCFSFKAPPIKTIKEHSYKVGETCYKFAPKDVKCPLTGVVEPFQWSMKMSRNASTR